jgi:hypothetical protein
MSAGPNRAAIWNFAGFGCAGELTTGMTVQKFYLISVERERAPGLRPDADDKPA